MVADAGVVDQDVQPASLPPPASMTAPASWVMSASSAATARPWFFISATAAAFRPVSRPTDDDLGARLPQGGGKRLAQPLIPAGDHGLAAIQRKTLQYPHMPS